jgi:hypothetical protein
VKVVATLTQDPVLHPYLAGQLALHGITTREPASVWLHAVYAIVASAPMDVLKAMDDKMIGLSARADPNRETWGATPEHQRAMAGLVRGVDADVPPPPRRTK